MVSNRNGPVDAPVNAALAARSKPSSRPVVSLKVPSHCMYRPAAAYKQPQNLRIYNIFQSMFYQQTATGGTNSQRQQGMAESGLENKKMKAPDVEKNDDAGATPNKHMSPNAASSSHTNVVPPDGTVETDRNAGGNVNRGDRALKDAFGLNNHLLDFLSDVPGWGPDREAPPVVDTDHNVAGADVKEDDDELQFPMDDLLDFDSYYAS